MKHLLLTLFLLMPLFLAARVQDNFADGDFTQNPGWSGDASGFTVNAQNQLQSNGPAVTGTTLYLSTSSTLATATEWEFWVNLKLATSSGNYTDIYLISDQSTLTGNINGYFVRIGNTQDEVSLYRQTGSTSTKIIDGTDGSISGTSNNTVKVKVHRSAAGFFTLAIDLTGTGNNYQIEGSATDNTHTTSAFFGILIKYSSANRQNFYFDDVEVQQEQGPVLQNVTVAGPQELLLQFNEAVDATFAQNLSNYSVSSGIGQPVAAQRVATNQKQVRLTFAANFPGGTHTLTTTNVADIFGVTPAAVQTAAFTLTAPAIAGVQVLGARQLQITFTEPVDAASAQNITNYSVSNGTGNPTAATLTNATTVVLDFATNFASGSSTLTASNIISAAGVPIAAPLTVTFTYTPPAVAAFREVRINEVMADFSPAVGLPAAEYIELYNTGNQ
ncbi:MAG: hypothetical protein LPK19_14800, partial [Hymenobacteraceae bacterium]|nr:hypothetical protein [Hymenobacteraceae bacterium]MDX5397501.1 hypothetical protein [Hymenobacteraceae bacterium]MDX5513580.1 hypothetical protein [Hymenobacteraceae bacterium]